MPQSSLSRSGRRGRLERLDAVLVDLELIDLVLERIEVDLFEPPLTRRAGGQREGGVGVRRDSNISAALLLGRWVRGCGELLGVERGRGELLDGQLDARGSSGSRAHGRRWRGSSISVVEVNVARSGGKDGVVLADGRVGSRMPRGTALPVDDLAWVHELACDRRRRRSETVDDEEGTASAT